MGSLVYLAILIAVCIVSGYVVGYNNGRNQPAEKVTPDQHKLQTFLIEIGKEANTITPTTTTIDHCHAKLQETITKGDLRGQRKYGRLLAAMVVKWMVERG